MNDFAATVSHQLHLDPSADSVEVQVGDAHHMEGIGNRLGIGEVVRYLGTIGVGEVGGDRGDAR